jgi:plastocyanin
MLKRSLVVGALTAALAVPAVSSAMSAPKLTGVVGPGFTISLKDSTGKKVTKLKAGKYTFSVTDKSSFHNFVVEKSGGSFEKAITSVGGTGKKTVTITLTKGKWEVYCAPHESTMHQSFTVT